MPKLEIGDVYISNMTKKEFSEENLDNSFPQREDANRQYWDDQQVFEKSIMQKKLGNRYVIYERPQSATELPHYWHLITHAIEDIVSRYQTMMGKMVERRFGWDCHGLPVESIVEKELGLFGGEEIRNFGVDKFNEACRRSVLRYSLERKATEKRLSGWIDMENDYKTMDTNYIESVWWVFNQLFEKGLIYEDKKVVPYSPRLSSPLSNFEATLNVKQIEEPSIVLSFQLAHSAEKLLVWTTTPWTLPANLALAVGKDIEYAKVQYKDDLYILAKDCLRLLEGGYELLGVLKGADLIGAAYLPIFDGFTQLGEKGAFRVVESSHVSCSEGTGIVHIAPAFGEDDYQVSQNNQIGIVDPLDNEGRFTAVIPELQGVYFRDANVKIIEKLKKYGTLLSKKKILKSAPHCWRSDTLLIHRTVPTWFVRVSDLKARMIANNQEIDWMPANLKEGRFGNWLKDTRDWAISRNRFWGAPIPIWRCEESGELLSIASKQELELLTGTVVADLHRDKIDGLTIEKDGKTFTRIPEILDCWFESGSMPYARHHYPFENKDKFEENFPADFVAEGIDQTRGWFYTLLVISTALFDKPPFRTAIVNGIVLAEDGRKMSKNLRNYPDPDELIQRVGSDALRYYFASSQAARAEELRFSEENVDLTVKKILLPIWNVYKFFIYHANAAGWKPEEGRADGKNQDRQVDILDQWILARLENLKHDATAAFKGNNLPNVTAAIDQFVKDLSNWYLKNSRNRFSNDIDTQSQNAAYETLFKTLVDLSHVMAPITPNIAESIFRGLTKQESVHLSDWPLGENEIMACEMFEEMEMVQAVVELGLALRNKSRVRIRQPLSEFIIYSENLADISKYEALIKNALNVKSVKLVSKEELNEKKDNSRYAFGQRKVHMAVLDLEISEELRAEGALWDLIRHIQGMRKKGEFAYDEKIVIAVEGAEEIITSNRVLLLRHISAENIEAKIDQPDIEEEVLILNKKVRLAIKRAVKG